MAGSGGFGPSQKTLFYIVLSKISFDDVKAARECMQQLSHSSAIEDGIVPSLGELLDRSLFLDLPVSHYTVFWDECQFFKAHGIMGQHPLSRAIARLVGLSKNAETSAKALEVLARLRSEDPDPITYFSRASGQLLAWLGVYESQLRQNATNDDSFKPWLSILPISGYPKDIVILNVDFEAELLESVIEQLVNELASPVDSIWIYQALGDSQVVNVIEEYVQRYDSDMNMSSASRIQVQSNRKDIASFMASLQPKRLPVFELAMINEILDNLREQRQITRLDAPIVFTVIRKFSMPINSAVIQQTDLVRYYFISQKDLKCVPVQASGLPGLALNYPAGQDFREVVLRPLIEDFLTVFPDKETKGGLYNSSPVLAYPIYESGKYVKTVFAQLVNQTQSPDVLVYDGDFKNLVLALDGASGASIWPKESWKIRPFLNAFAQVCPLFSYSSNGTQRVTYPAWPGYFYEGQLIRDSSSGRLSATTITQTTSGRTHTQSAFVLVYYSLTQGNFQTQMQLGDHAFAKLSRHPFSESSLLSDGELEAIKSLHIDGESFEVTQERFNLIPDQSPETCLDFNGPVCATRDSFQALKSMQKAVIGYKETFASMYDSNYEMRAEFLLRRRQRQNSEQFQFWGGFEVLANAGHFELFIADCRALVNAFLDADEEAEAQIVGKYQDVLPVVSGDLKKFNSYIMEYTPQGVQPIQLFSEDMNLAAPAVIAQLLELKNEILYYHVVLPRIDLMKLPSSKGATLAHYNTHLQTFSMVKQIYQRTRQTMSLEDFDSAEFQVLTAVSEVHDARYFAFTTAVDTAEATYDEVRKTASSEAMQGKSLLSQRFVTHPIVSRATYLDKRSAVSSYLVLELESESAVSECAGSLGDFVLLSDAADVQAGVVPQSMRSSLLSVSLRARLAKAGLLKLHNVSTSTQEWFQAANLAFSDINNISGAEDIGLFWTGDEQFNETEYNNKAISVEAGEEFGFAGGKITAFPLGMLQGCLLLLQDVLWNSSDAAELIAEQKRAFRKAGSDATHLTKGYAVIDLVRQAYTPKSGPTIGDSIDMPVRTILTVVLGVLLFFAGCSFRGEEAQARDPRLKFIGRRTWCPGGVFTQQSAPSKGYAMQRSISIRPSSPPEPTRDELFLDDSREQIKSQIVRQLHASLGGPKSLLSYLKFGRVADPDTNPGFRVLDGEMHLLVDGFTDLELQRNFLILQNASPERIGETIVVQDVEPQSLPVKRLRDGLIEDVPQGVGREEVEFKLERYDERDFVCFAQRLENTAEPRIKEMVCSKPAGSKAELGL